MARPTGPLPEVDVTRPHPVRIYNYWLGGKDHYAADRELGDAMIVELPGLAMTARAHRSFLERAVRYLAAAGTTRFLLLGAGLPTTYNLHQVAQEADARRILDGLLDRLAPGSHLILTHPTADFDQGAVVRAMRVGLASGFTQSVRSRDEFSALFAGLELVDPGVVPILAWRPDERGPQRDVHSVHLLGGVGRKP